MGSQMPRDRHEMRRANYEYRGTSACKSCGAAIEWWKTTNGKNMPFDPPKAADPEAAEHEYAVTHWVTCPNARQHRADRTAAAPATAPASTLFDGPATQQNKQQMTERQTPELLQRETEWFARRHGARCVVTLCGGALDVFTVRDGEDAEQLRSDLITLANAARNHALNRKKETVHAL